MKTVLDTTHSRVSWTPGGANSTTISFANFDGNFTISRLMAIINQTRNTIIYAEGQTGLGYVSYNASTRLLTLQADTTGNLSTDVLQVIYDTPATPIVPQEEYFDPVNKHRVSTPQSLIDTDFEYGVQSTKWESVFLINNRPTGFYEPNTPLENTTGGTITAMNVTNGSRTVTVAINNTTGLSVGSLIYVQDTLNSAGNGWFRIDTLTTNTSFTYTGDIAFTLTGDIFDANRTLIYLGGWYTGSRIIVTGLTNSGTTVTATTLYAHGLAVGNNIFLDNTVATTNAPNGSWSITRVPTANTFEFVVINAPSGTITGGYTASGSVQSLNGGSATNATTTITLTTPSAHNLVPGNIITVAGTTATTNAPNGTFVVLTTPSSTQLTYLVAAAPTGVISVTSATLVSNATILLYARPGGFIQHRPFDGGVTMSSGAGLPNSTLIRQTRKYFRYQSGKGLQFSTGSIFRPALQLNNITAGSLTPGATITVTSKVPHGLVVGSQVTVSNSVDTALNGTFEVISVPSETTFTYTSVSAPTTLQSQSSNVIVTPANIFGAAVRLGMFDTQNGIFFESDGSTLYACRRSSTLQLTGLVNCTSSNITQQIGLPSANPPTFVGSTITVNTATAHGLVVGSNFTIAGLTATTNAPNGTFSVASVTSTTQFTYIATATPTGTIGAPQGSALLTVNSNVVTGVGTLFSQQLFPGDYVVIKGKSYRVNSISSDTSMIITPEYRGNSVSNTTISKTVDLRIPQSQWNIDKFDGTGPSGFNLDTGRMQMAYIDYSWYGAGFIRYGFRAAGGNVTYGHKILNNNTNTEAYMRSGNLPARYEENTLCPTTYLRATLNSAETTTITVDSAASFPTRGVIRIFNPGNTGVVEYIRYTGKTATTLTGLTRGLAQGSTATTFTYTAPPAGTTFTPTPIAIELVGPNGNSGSSVFPVAQTLSHWGSAVIMDGRFDNDQNYVFSAGQNNPISISLNATNVILAIRLCPSVDNGRVGLLGVRDLINRMQLQLRSMDTITTGQFRIDVILNGRVNTTSITASSNVVAGVAYVVTTLGNTSLAQWQLLFSGLNALPAVGDVLFATSTGTLQGGTPATVTGTVRFSNIGGSSLAQVALAPASTTLSGGESIFSFFTNSGVQQNQQGASQPNYTQYAYTTQDLSFIRELGNSVLGGATSNTVPTVGNAGMYPDGPDILYITARNVDTAATRQISSRISWIESQA